MSNQTEKIKAFLELINTKVVTPKQLKEFLVLVLQVVRNAEKDIVELSQDGIRTMTEAIELIDGKRTDIEELLSGTTEAKAELRKELDSVRSEIKDILNHVSTPIHGKDGKKGKDGKAGKSGKDGKSIKGDDGIDGKTPIRGKDYFTKSDIDKFKKEILEEIPDIDEKELAKKIWKKLPTPKSADGLGGSIARNFYQLFDVTITPPLEADDLPAYDTTTNQWTNQSKYELEIIESGADITDHTIVRGDGGARGVQDSGITVSDTNDMAFATPSNKVFWNKIIYVKNEGATPIQDALDSITDAGFTNRYIVQLDPSIYTETITLPPFIDLAGAGVNWSTVLTDVVVTWSASELEVGSIKHVQLVDMAVTFTNAGFVKGLVLFDILTFSGTITGQGQNNNAIGGHIIHIRNSDVVSTPSFTGGIYVETRGTVLGDGLTMSGDTVWCHNEGTLEETFTFSDTASAFIRSGAVCENPETEQSIFIAPSGTKLNIDGGTFSTADTTQVADEVLQLQDGVSAGVIEPKYTFTDNGDGTFTITDFPVFLYNNSNQKGKPRRYDITGLTDQSLTDNSSNYVAVDFNSGSPQIRIDTSDVGNKSDIVTFLSAYREGNELHFYELNTVGEGLADKLEERQLDIARFERANGLALGEVATRIVTLTSGKIYSGASPISLIAVNSSTDTYEQYGNVSGVQTKNPNGAQTQYNNFYYDDGTDLVEALPNRYLVEWIYRDIDDDAHMFEVFGAGDYLTLSLAELEAPPTDLPSIITNNTILVGRIIVQKDAVSGIIESAFTVQFTSSGVITHNDTSSIQGGTTDEYYHLTSAEHTNLVSFGNEGEYMLLDGSRDMTGDVSVPQGQKLNLEGSAGDTYFTFDGTNVFLYVNGVLKQTW